MVVLILSLVVFGLLYFLKLSKNSPGTEDSFGNSSSFNFNSDSGSDGDSGCDGGDGGCD